MPFLVRKLDHVQGINEHPDYTSTHYRSNSHPIARHTVSLLMEVDRTLLEEVPSRMGIPLQLRIVFITIILLCTTNGAGKENVSRDHDILCTGALDEIAHTSLTVTRSVNDSTIISSFNFLLDSRFSEGEYFSSLQQNIRIGKEWKTNRNSKAFNLLIHSFPVLSGCIANDPTR